MIVVTGCCCVGGFGNGDDVGGLIDDCVVVCDDNTASLAAICTRLPCMWWIVVAVDVKLSTARTSTTCSIMHACNLRSRTRISHFCRRCRSSRSRRCTRRCTSRSCSRSPRSRHTPRPRSGTRRYLNTYRHRYHSAITEHKTTKFLVIYEACHAVLNSIPLYISCPRECAIPMWIFARHSSRLRVKHICEHELQQRLYIER